MLNKRIWFEQVKQSPPCNSEQLNALGELFINLLDNTDTALAHSSPVLKDNFPRLIFISVSEAGKTAKIYCGEGFGFIETLKNAYDQSQFSLKKNTLFKIDVVEKVRDLQKLTKDTKIDLRYTLEGLAFSNKAHFAVLPEQIFAHNLFDEKTQLINYENLYEALALNPLASAHLARLLKGNLIRLFAFRTSSILVQEKTVRLLFRGNLIRQDFSRQDIQSSLEKAALYLAQSINTSGKFNYIFRPDIRYYPHEYNMPRHAGTLYAMFEYCETFPNSNVLNAAKRGVNFLFEQMLTGNTANSLCVLDRGVVSLGSNALAAIALEKGIKTTGDKNYLPVLIKLGNSIINALQNTGAFKPQRHFYLEEVTIKDVQSAYFPGEAALALLRIYGLNKEEKWLEAAEKAIHWLITVRDKTIPDFFHDHWLTYSLNEIYQYRKNPFYLAHAKKICHSTLTQQIQESPYLDWRGGYGKNPRSTPAATRGEGLYAAYCLFKQYGKDEAFLKTIQNVYHKLILFTLSTQFLEESTLYFSDPLAPLGGFQGSHTSGEIRIDYVQHNISSLLGYYKLFLEK